MVEFPNVFVDQHFSHLLCQDLQACQRTNQLITRYITDHHSFHQLVTNCFLDNGPKKRVYSIIKILGWKSFRNHLASVFIFYACHHKFPRKTHFPLAKDLIEFDIQTTPYTTSGSSRAFLLALYLKLSQIYLAKSQDDFTEDQLEIPSSVLFLFKKAKMNVVQIDWAVLLLWHFADAMGVEKLDTLLGQKKGLQELQSLLTTEQQDKLYTNLLIYSYAINDQNFFEAGIF